MRRKKYAVVQPGLINDDLRDAAEKHHLTFAPDPATHEYCTLGGMIGNNSCGDHVGTERPMPGRVEAITARAA